MHRRAATVTVVLGLLAGGCRGSGAPRGAGGEGVAGPVERLPPEVEAAERALRAVHPDEAERLLEAAGGLDAAAPERSWLLLDLWTTRAAAARARAEAGRLPSWGAGAVLQAHVLADPEARIAAARRALSGPAAGWAHLETAMALAEEGGREAPARAHAARAAALGPAFVRREALLLAAVEALEKKDGEAALGLAREAASVDPADPRGPGTASRIAGRLGRTEEAVLEALTALRLQPGSLRAARRLAEFLRDEIGEERERVVRATLPLVRDPPEGNPERWALDGLLAERAGDRDRAVERYRAALRGGADPVPVDRHLRHLLFARGDRREALRWLRGAVPPRSVARAGNVVAGAWAALEGAGAETPDGTASPAAAPALARLAAALEGVGAVEDAAIVARDVRTPAGSALAARLEGVVAFERALRAVVEEGYRAPASGREPEPVERLLERLPALARRHLPPGDRAAFDDPARALRAVPLLGRWLDHSVATASPVVAWFRTHGQYLVLGQRDGKPAEAVLISLAALVPGAVIETHGRTFRHDLAVGYDRIIRPYVDFQGGGISGAALPDGVWLDADAARREDAGLRLVRRADATLLARVRAVGLDPPAPDGPEGVLSLDDPAGLATRLALDHVAHAGPDPWATFDVLEAHESGHVFDLERHLPIVQGLPATVGLLARAGFSLDAAEGVLEGRAQLSALVESRDPRLALLDLVRPLPLHERAPEAHERGYRDVVARLVRRLLAEADRFPAIDPARTLLPQLDRLPPEALRILGREIDEDR